MICILKKLLALGLLIGGLIAEIAWLGVCFGTVIIGVVLLIFAPQILLIPIVTGITFAKVVNDSCD